MSGLVKMLKPEDRFNIAVFYAGETVKASTAGTGQMKAEGGRHFARTCAGCHGQTARGSREIARLAGQQAIYLKNALEGYRRGNGVRSDPRMTGVARKLSDGEIAALVAYLSALD